MARTIYGLGLCMALAAVVAACGDGNSGSSGTTDSGGAAGSSGSSGASGAGATSGSAGSNTTGGSAGTTGGSAGTGATGGTTGGSAGTGGTTGGSAGTGGTTGGTAGSGGTKTGSGGSGGMMTGSGGAGGTTGTGGSDQIAAVRAAADGAVDLPIKGAFVTYTKPLLGMDAAGFFIQAEAAGPAIFVAVDPTSLMPSPKVGDQYDFTATMVGTQTGLKEVTAIAGGMVVTSGNDIQPLVTEISAAADVVMNLATYESRAIRITGSLPANFVGAGAPQVATKIVTAGLDDANLRLRMPDAIRATYDLGAGCMASVDYGVMWRFNAVAQPSVYSATDLKGLTCPAPTVLKAVPLSPTQVVVSFDRKIDPATVDAADFMFDNGLMATMASLNANGTDVTVTTTMDVPGLTYTVTVSNLDDVLGAPIGMPNTAMFQSFVATAEMVFNEINPNIGSAHDLIELLVTTGGSTNGITLVQKGSATDMLATLPDVVVAAGDLIVVHLTPVGATGTAPGSETLTKNQYLNAAFSANYDGAWDFHGNAVGLTFSNRVLYLNSAANVVLDAVPVVLTGQSPAAFPGDLQALQAAGLWFPADCGGALCTYASMPTALEVSVNYVGAGNNAAGNSVQRKPGMNTKKNTDWNAAAAQSFGLINP